MLVIHQLKTLKDIFRARRQAAGAAAVLAYCLQVWFARDGGPQWAYTRSAELWALGGLGTGSPDRPQPAGTSCGATTLTRGQGGQVSGGDGHN